jgi:parallel beta-helix repeat protein
MRSRFILAALALAGLMAVSAFAGDGIVSLYSVNGSVSSNTVKAGEPVRFLIRYTNDIGIKCDVSTGFRLSSPDGAVWDSTSIDSVGPFDAGEWTFGKRFPIASALLAKNTDGHSPDTVGYLGAGRPMKTTDQLPVGFDDSVFAVTAWFTGTSAAGKHICIDSAFYNPGGTWSWIDKNLTIYYPTFTGRTISEVHEPGVGFCFAIGSDSIPPGDHVLRVPSEYAKIQSAITAAVDGDTVLVASGTYVENLNLNGKRILLTSEGGRGVTTVKATAGSAPVITLTSGEDTMTVIDGLGIDGDGRVQGVFCENSSATIQNCDIHNCATSYDGGGMYFNLSAAKVRFNLIHDNYAPATGGGICVRGETVGEFEIANNHIYSTLGTAEAIGCLYSTNLYIHHNVLSFNVGSSWAASGVYLNAVGDNVRIVNNTIMNNSHGIVPYGGSQPLVMNNIVGNSSVSGIPSGLTNSDYNDVWQNVADNNPGPHGISIDPQFTDSTYHLMLLSPCINAGNPDPIYNDPNGSRNDIGAFPYPGGITPDTSIINLVQWKKADGGNDHWYAVFPKTLSWEGANSWAGRLSVDGKSGYLATIASAAENDFIEDHVLAGTSQPLTNNGMDQFYLGGIYVDTLWRWITAEPFSYTKWADGEPNNPGGENAMAIFGPNNLDPRRAFGFWNSVVRSSELSDSIHRAWSLVEFGAADSGNGLINLVQWKIADGGNDHWYAICPQTLSYETSRSQAAQYRQGSLVGYLATITSAAENDFITNHVIAGTSQPLTNNGMDQFYLGGIYVDTLWRWLTSEPFTYSKWDSGEPNNPGGETALALFGPNNTDPMRHFGFWNSVVRSDSTYDLIHRAWSLVEFGTNEGLTSLVQWKKADGGNDHWYGINPQTLFYATARAKATDFRQDGMPGYLATITSAEENDFIKNHVLAGTTQPLTNNGMDQFYLGGIYLDTEWTWLTGEPFHYSYWANGEPNNPGYETAMAIFGPNNVDERRTFGFWNSVVRSDSTYDLIHRSWSLVEFGVPDSGNGGPMPTNAWIILYCQHAMLDSMVLPMGSVLNAYDPQGVLCGQITVQDSGKFGPLLVYADDPYTTIDEGAVKGDLITFKLNGQPIVPSASVIWTENGAMSQVCSFQSGVCRQIALHSGWNLISWNVTFDGSVESLLGSAKDAVDVMLGFDQGGLVYIPSLPQFSTLTMVDHHHGYWIKANREAVLNVCGGETQCGDNIPIYSGWNLVSYEFASPYPTTSAFHSIMNSVQVILGYDLGGKVFVPDQPDFNTLTTLSPGFGYWVRSMGANTLLKDDCLDGWASRPVSPVVSTGTPALGSRFWISVYGTGITLDGKPLAKGASVQFVTADDIVVGRSTYGDGLLKFTPVYGVDNQDAATRSFPKEGDQVYAVIAGVRTSPAITWTSHGAVQRLTELTAAASLPRAYNLLQNYPNPFNPQTTIEFALPEAGHVRVVVFNLLGQAIKTLADGDYAAGSFKLTWDGTNATGSSVASGVYFYRIEANNYRSSKKMMLLK